jgi:hypothetical protein
MINEEINQSTYQPIIFRLNEITDRNTLLQLQNDGLITETIDALDEAIEDLFKIDFPFIQTDAPEYEKTLHRYREKYYNNQEPEIVGVWVYYSWRQTLVHIPDNLDFQKLRTSRNAFLVTEEEQQNFSRAIVGVAGLSVGASAVNTIVLSSGAHHIRLADADTLAITNLNRLQLSVCDLKRNKAICAARKVFEINPFQIVELFDQGITTESLNNFFVSKGKKLNLFLEEMDSISLKIKTRFKARELGIPVVMVTDDGDNTLVDVERFDLEPDRPLFHGHVNENLLKKIPSKPSAAEKANLAVKIVGTDISPRMQLALTMVGAKISAWPQLATAASLSGVAACYIARRIVSGQEMPSGRYEVKLDAVLDPTYSSSKAIEYRKQQKADFVSAFQLLFGEE